MKRETPKIMPGACYLQYSADGRPSYSWIMHCAPDLSGRWIGMLFDADMGMVTIKEGEDTLKFYARVQTPVEDRDNPVILEAGIEFMTRSEVLEMAQRAEELRRLQRKRFLAGAAGAL